MLLATGGAAGGSPAVRAVLALAVATPNAGPAINGLQLVLTPAGLNHAHGKALGDPDAVVACVIRDAEAGLPNLGLSPINDGVVLPVLALDGGPDVAVTLELYGLGHRPIEVVGADDFGQLREDLACAIDWALTEIAALRVHARNSQDDTRPRWPIIVLHTVA